MADTHITMDAIAEAFDAEQSDNNDANNDESDDLKPLTPATGGYLVAANEGAVRSALIMAVVEDEMGDDAPDKMSDLVDGFNPNQYRMTEDGLAEAARDAMLAAKDVLGHVDATIGAWGAMKVVKGTWGDHHTDVVSGEGHHGVGLDHSGDISVAADDSYGDHHPSLPAFNDVVGWRTPDGGEVSTYNDYGIDIAEFGVTNDGGPKLLDPDDGDLPLAVYDQDALEEFVSVLLTLPTELPGPDAYDGSGVDETSEEPEEPVDNEETADIPDELPEWYDPVEGNVGQVKDNITSVDSLELAETIMATERDHQDRTTAKNRIQSRMNKLAREEHDRTDNNDESDDESDESGGNDADDVDTEVDDEATLDERIKAYNNLCEAGVDPDEAADRAGI